MTQQERKSEKIALGLLRLEVAMSAPTTMLVPIVWGKRVSSLVAKCMINTFLRFRSAEAQEAGEENQDFCCKRAERTTKE